MIADASSVVHQILEFATPARGIRIYPWKYLNWICLRVELYGFYFSGGMCASSGPVPPTKKTCVGDRNCGQNAACMKEPKNRIPKQGN